MIGFLEFFNFRLVLLVFGALGFIDLFRRFFFPFVFERFCFANSQIHVELEEEEDDNDFNRWWKIARTVRLLGEENAHVAFATLDWVTEARLRAQQFFFKNKLKGDVPSILWLTGWSGFYRELSIDERSIFCSLLCVVLYHCCTIGLASKSWILSAQMTWAFNMADLVLIALGFPNANGARNAGQLVLHHCASVLGIPILLMACPLDMSMILRYILFLEGTGGLSAVLIVLSFTPFSVERGAFYFAAVCYVCFVLIRGPLWITLLADIVKGCDTVSQMALATLFHLVMAYFNWFFLKAWLKKLFIIARQTGFDKNKYLGRTMG